MAAKLQCEICGGELIGRPGGIFECDSCGIKFDTAWAKAKVQEIQGTVKVEGTVEVQGTVKVEGAANKERLLERGNLALEDGAWGKAQDYFDQVLNIDPRSADAYFGLLFPELHIKGLEMLAESRDKRLKQIRSSGAYQKFIRFASVERGAALNEAVERANAAILAQEKQEADALAERIRERETALALQRQHEEAEAAEKKRLEAGQKIWEYKKRNWKLFDHIRTIEQEGKESMERAELERKENSCNKERSCPL